MEFALFLVLFAKTLSLGIGSVAGYHSVVEKDSEETKVLFSGVWTLVPAGPHRLSGSQESGGHDVCEVTANAAELIGNSRVMS